MTQLCFSFFAGGVGSFSAGDLCFWLCCLQGEKARVRCGLLLFSMLGREVLARRRVRVVGSLLGQLFQFENVSSRCTSMYVLH